MCDVTTWRCQLTAHREAGERVTMARGRLTSHRRPVGRYSVAVVIAVVLMTVACGDRDTASHTQNARSRVPVYHYLNPLTVDDLLAAITNTGLAAPNPRNVTEQECPAIGCANMMQTDTVAIIEFETPGQAQLYAGSTHHIFQIENVVLRFSPSVPKEQQRAYDDAVKRAIG